MSDSIADLYRGMLTVRRIEEKVMLALSQGLVSGSTHLCIGQEAIPVGACAALRTDDPIIATYRGHGWVLARGVDPADLLGEIMGRESALNGGRAGSAYLSAVDHAFYGENSIVGAGVPIALGLGLACKSSGDGTVPLVSIGDGAMNQGNVHEALNMASVLKVPLILVVENNGYAEMTPSSMLTAVPAAQRAAAYGIPGVEVDGNDPVAVFRAVAEARDTTMSTGVPVLVEAHTHRLVGHYSGDAQVYRPPGELEAWRLHDPLVRAEAELPPEEVHRIGLEVDHLAEDAFTRAAQMPYPSGQEATTHVYVH